MSLPMKAVLMIVLTSIFFGLQHSISPYWWDGAWPQKAVTNNYIALSIRIHDRYPKFASELRAAQKSFSLHHKDRIERILKSGGLPIKEDLLTEQFDLNQVTDGHLEKAGWIIEEIDPYDYIEIDPEFADIVDRLRAKMRGILLAELERVRFLENSPVLPGGFGPENPDKGAATIKNDNDLKAVMERMGRGWGKAEVEKWQKQLTQVTNSYSEFVQQLNELWEQEKAMETNLWKSKYPWLLRD